MLATDVVIRIALGRALKAQGRGDWGLWRSEVDESGCHGLGGVIADGVCFGYQNG